MRVYRDREENGVIVQDVVFDIMECTYSGKDMGERSVTANIKWPSPIAFRPGDYIELQMQNMIKNPGEMSGGIEYERFYLYQMPTIKKTARSMSAGDAFEHTLVFYPHQYELNCVQMRDFNYRDPGNAQSVIYTGFDQVTFYGGAHELMIRIIACLDEAHETDKTGTIGKWSYLMAPAVDETQNTALESFTFNFSGNSVMDALLYLNKEDYCNTTFFINDRTIYVGFKRPYFCKVDGRMNIEQTPLRLMYGKTSHENVDLDHGGLFDITKSVGHESPITKLYAYGANRNLNRYYCTDRIKGGRFVNKLMLPSFDNDGQTDYVLSDMVEKYGIREGSKTFDEIYPSLRYMTYSDLRKIKYVIKVKGSGVSEENGKILSHDTPDEYSYPVARIQCYKVVPCTGGDDGVVGINKLVECAPDEDLAVFVHAKGKTVRVVLYGGPNALDKQRAHDYYVPGRNGKIGANDDASQAIPGSCFLVHDNGWPAMNKTFNEDNGMEYEQEHMFTPDELWNDDTKLQEDGEKRYKWFTAPFNYPEKPYDKYASLYRIEYVDTFWLTDHYVFKSYDQTNFQRDGYSAYCYARFNDVDKYPDETLVNEVVGVEPIVITDTSENLENNKAQQTFDVYLRDVGFPIDEQNDFGEMVFLFDTPKLSVLDGFLAGYEFEFSNGNTINDNQDRVIPAYTPAGKVNRDGETAVSFFDGSISYAGDAVPARAFENGAMWRIRVNRANMDNQNQALANLGLILPTEDMAMKEGDHVVFLDIFMPDIYILAAEQRLEREAYKYLDKVDNGNVSYSVNFDKVRIQQIPAYALQMREGVTMRIEDEDLQIESENKMRILIDNKNGIRQNTSLKDKIVKRQSFLTSYGYEKRIPEVDTKVILPSKMYLMVDKRAFDDFKARGVVDIYLGFNENRHVTQSMKKMTVKVTDCYIISKTSPEYQDGIKGMRKEDLADPNNVMVMFYTLPNQSYEVIDKGFDRRMLSYTATYEETISAVDGDIIPIKGVANIDFLPGKYYEVVVDVQSGVEIAPYAETEDESGNKIILSTPISVFSKIDGEMRINPIDEPSASPEDGYVRHTFKFYLPEQFDDNGESKFAVNCIYREGMESVSMIMYSVICRDIDETGTVVKYVDFVVESCSIKIRDNSRSVGEARLDPHEQQRRVLTAPEPMREITATIKEKTQASGWGALMQQVDEMRIETEMTTRQFEDLARAARVNYNKLLSLKNSIFDPDGTCNNVFLQVMMMQVGADSMNYRLEKTDYRLGTGKEQNPDMMLNCSIEGPAGQQHFNVFASDILHHYVYTQGSNGGDWIIDGNFDKQLVQVGNEWPVYYIALKCPRDGSGHGQWVCDTKQFAVNEEGYDDYWFFNWAILTPDSNGNYDLIVTRGNAYMYGDNLICGRISSLAGNSYFDLTNGDFVLSKSGDIDKAALSYINGVLTIGGLPDSDKINEMLEKLGLIDKQKIGGENLSPVGSFLLEEGNTGQSITLAKLDSNMQYVVSGTHIGYNLRLYVSFDDEITVLRDFTYDGGAFFEIPFKTKSTPSDIYLRAVVTTGYGAGINNLMLQKGTKSTAYQPYIDHITNAIKETTEIVGGLAMTHVLALRDSAKNITAGMNGLEDSNVAMWAGGTMEEADAGTTPVLITKGGAGSRIGCFKVLNDHQVSVETDLGTIYISGGDKNSPGSITIVKDEKEIVSISGSEVNEDVPVSEVTTYATDGPFVDSEGRSFNLAYKPDGVGENTSQGAGYYMHNIIYGGVYVFTLRKPSLFVTKNLQIKLLILSSQMNNTWDYAIDMRFNMVSKSDEDIDYNISIPITRISLTQHDRWEATINIPETYYNFLFSAGRYTPSRWTIFRVLHGNVSSDGKFSTNGYIDTYKYAAYFSIYNYGQTDMTKPAQFTFRPVQGNQAVRIGSNGMIVQTGNSSYTKIVSDNGLNKMVLAGLPMWNMSGQDPSLETGQLFMDPSGNLKVKL